MEIGVIDYGVGNLSSTVNMINKVEGVARIVSSPHVDVLLRAPNLHELAIHREAAQQGVPL